MLHADIEIVRPLPRGRFRKALFDFDGTLSLIREGWPQVMIPMMVAELRGCPRAESETELVQVVENFVMRLNGKQTIYQMIQLAEEVRRRGGESREPLEYKHRYHDLLMARIDGRLAALRTGAARPEEWTVPGSQAFLEALGNRGLTLYLASGTDLKYVRTEVALLQLEGFFGSRVFGALDDYENFSKKMVVEQIIREHDLTGAELIGFGDGFVEIEEIKKVGGLAIAVASDEVRREGINAWKRDRLIQAGADIVIPDYRHGPELLEYLFPT